MFKCSNVWLWSVLVLTTAEILTIRKHPLENSYSSSTPGCLTANNLSSVANGSSSARNSRDQICIHGDPPAVQHTSSPPLCLLTKTNPSRSTVN